VQVVQRMEKLVESELLSSMLAVLHCDSLSEYLSSCLVADLIAVMHDDMLHPTFNPLTDLHMVLNKRLAAIESSMRRCHGRRTGSQRPHYRSFHILREHSELWGYSLFPEHCGCRNLPDVLAMMGHLIDLHKVESGWEWPLVAPSAELLLQQLLLRMVHAAARGADGAQEQAGANAANMVHDQDTPTRALSSSAAGGNARNEADVHGDKDLRRPDRPPLRVTITELTQSFAEEYGVPHPAADAGTMLAAVQALAWQFLVEVNEGADEVTVSVLDGAVHIPMEACAEHASVLQAYLQRAYVDCDESVLMRHRASGVARRARVQAPGITRRPYESAPGAAGNGRPATAKRSAPASSSAPSKRVRRASTITPTLVGSGPGMQWSPSADHGAITAPNDRWPALTSIQYSQERIAVTERLNPPSAIHPPATHSWRGPSTADTRPHGSRDAVARAASSVTCGPASPGGFFCSRSRLEEHARRQAGDCLPSSCSGPGYASATAAGVFEGARQLGGALHHLPPDVDHYCLPLSPGCAAPPKAEARPCYDLYDCTATALSHSNPATHDPMHEGSSFDHARHGRIDSCHDPSSHPCGNFSSSYMGQHQDGNAVAASQDAATLGVACRLDARYVDTCELDPRRAVTMIYSPPPDGNTYSAPAQDFAYPQPVAECVVEPLHAQLPSLTPARLAFPPPRPQPHHNVGEWPQVSGLHAAPCTLL
jgi:hypothetical protein